jgi:hypothetical protein
MNTYWAYIEIPVCPSVHPCFSQTARRWKTASIKDVPLGATTLVTLPTFVYFEN